MLLRIACTSSPASLVSWNTATIWYTRVCASNIWFITPTIMWTNFTEWGLGLKNISLFLGIFKYHCANCTGDTGHGLYLPNISSHRLIIIVLKDLGYGSNFKPCQNKTRTRSLSIKQTFNHVYLWLPINIYTPCIPVHEALSSKSCNYRLVYHQNIKTICHYSHMILIHSLSWHF